MARIRPMDFKIDYVDQLLAACQEVAKDPETRKFRPQTAIQTGGVDDWLEGTGSHPDSDETQWDKLIPAVQGTIIQEFIESLPWKVYRSRIMCQHPRSCYSFHKDPSPRLHIALKTHPQAKFIFTTPAEIVHIKADGKIYWVDTRYEHTAVNGSMDFRWHIVMSLTNDSED